MPVPAAHRAAMSTNGQSHEGLMTKEELCKFLKLDDAECVDRLRRAKKIPAIRLGYKTYRYQIDKVQAALAKLEIKEAGVDRK